MTIKAWPVTRGQQSQHSFNWETKIILLISIISVLKAIEVYIGINTQLLAVLQGPIFIIYFIFFIPFHISLSFDLFLNLIFKLLMQNLLIFSPKLKAFND